MDVQLNTYVAFGCFVREIKHYQRGKLHVTKIIWHHRVHFVISHGSLMKNWTEWPTDGRSDRYVSPFLQHKLSYIINSIGYPYKWQINSSFFCKYINSCHYHLKKSLRGRQPLQERRDLAARASGWYGRARDTWSGGAVCARASRAAPWRTRRGAGTRSALVYPPGTRHLAGWNMKYKIIVFNTFVNSLKVKI